MPAQIDDGRWTRNVPWRHYGVWRTDIFKTTLANPALLECVFVLADGPRVAIPARDLRKVVEGGPDRYTEQIWGPFSIDPMAQTVSGQPVEIQVFEQGA